MQTRKTYPSDLSQEFRLRLGWQADPSTVSIDSQSVKASDTGSCHGFDGAKKIRGTNAIYWWIARGY